MRKLIKFFEEKGNKEIAGHFRRKLFTELHKMNNEEESPL